MKNNGYFFTAWLFLWTSFIKNSLLYRVLSGIYSFISSKWQSSFISGLFKKTFIKDLDVSKSILGKICFFPFHFVECLQKKCGTFLSNIKDRSFIVRSCKYYLHNFLALNLRFIGVFAVSMCFVSLVISLFQGTGIRLELLGILAGSVLLLLNVNLTGLLKGSLIVKFVEAILGTEFSFDFYYITKCGGIKSIFCALFFGTVSGIIAGLLSPVFAIIFALGLWFLFMVLYKVEFGVFAILFLAPIIPTMAVVGLSLLCLFSLVIRAITTKRFTFKTDGLGLMVIIMLVLYLFACFTSFAPFKSVQIWAVYFAFMVFYFVVINTIKTKSQLMNLLTVFCLSGLVVCLYGILQYIFGWNVSQAWIDEEMFEDIKMRIYSTLENPNVLGEYILLVLPVSIGLMWKKKNILSKIFYLGVTGVLGIALILTFSRGCWIGIMAAAAVYVTFAAGKLWGLALLLLPLVPMILPESIIKRFTSIGNMGDSSTSYRVYIWMGTLLMMRDFWLSGIGLGTEAFTQIYPFYSYSSIVAPHSHNLFLQIWVESGILGILTFFVLLIVFVRNLAKGYAVQGKYGDLSVVLVAIGSAVSGFLVQGLFDNCFYNYRVFMIFWSVLALGMAAVNIVRDEASQKEVGTNA